jgi:hypothetical protein
MAEAEFVNWIADRLNRSFRRANQLLEAKPHEGPISAADPGRKMFH